MSDENMSADAMLALARDHDAGVDIDSQRSEQAPTNEPAPAEQESPSEVTASKEVDGGEQEVGTKPEAETKVKPAEEKPKDKSSKFAQEQQRKAKTLVATSGYLFYSVGKIF